MKKEKDILEQAAQALKNGQIPSGPPKDLADATLTKLNQASMQSNQAHLDKQLLRTKRLRLFNSFIRIAAAVIVLIAIGYTTGRLSAPKTQDLSQIQSALEPAIREKLLEEITQYIQSGFSESYVSMRQELTEQYRRDLSQAALDILTASGTLTNRLLEELIYSIDTAQAQDRQLIAAALEQVELNRLEDNGLLSNALYNLTTHAAKTEEELDRTQQNMALIAKILSDTQSGNLIPSENKNLNN